MNMIATKDGTQLYYKDWGTGPAVVFSHGWPLCADAWDSQMKFIADQGYRCIAYDRRGHGRSSQPWQGNDYDTFADDLADLVICLALSDVTLVGHSMGGGEIARYVGRHGTSKVSKIVLVSSVTPLMLKTENNPLGLPVSVFDEIRAGVIKDRSQFYQDLSVKFYGNNHHLINKVSQGVLDAFWLRGMAGGLKNQFDCIQAFSETDFTEDLKKIDVPTLIIHGDDDQIVPIEASALSAAKLIKNTKLSVYKGGSHGLADANTDQLNADLLDFLNT
ncbi:MAG: alpha/beta hydrolase [Methylophilaceae bacterium]|nr:alpha/beta hydrolase [Methylophilaceae bacterium]